MGKDRTGARPRTQAVLSLHARSGHFNTCDRGVLLNSHEDITPYSSVSWSGIRIAQAVEGDVPNGNK